MLDSVVTSCGVRTACKVSKLRCIGTNSSTQSQNPCRMFDRKPICVSGGPPHLPRRRLSGMMFGTLEPSNIICRYGPKLSNRTTVNQHPKLGKAGQAPT